MPFSLDDLTSDIQLSRLTLEELSSLAESIRSEILETVSRQGGHLASNLGNLELVLALHSVFDFSRDRIFFDTGHQCYTHKLLTGRREQFRRLREEDGCCGFPLPQESGSDLMATGHSGTAISSALGFAAARDKIGGTEKIVVMVGDGALGCGSSLEGLNNIAVTTRDFLLVLNDNKMSIAPNVGAISRFLNHVISARSYNLLKTCCSSLVMNVPLLGKWLKLLASRMESALKSLLIHQNMFDDLGLRYIGPVDGHDLLSLQSILKRVKKLHGPILLHVLTRKGKGYKPAEDEPSRFHGTGPFDLETGKSLKKSTSPNFSSVFGESLCALRRDDSRICGITAGMSGGTGLSGFAEQYPESFYDVGIAEGHGAAFTAGLAASGQKPVFAVYASFSQRAIDYAFQDVCLNSLPVVFCLDRAGVVVDGPTHHGIQDLAFWRVLPGITVMQPSDASELREMLTAALKSGKPSVIRYPSGDASDLPVSREPLEWGRAAVVRGGASPVALWCVGRELATGLEVCSILEKEGIHPTLVNARFVLPFDRELMAEQIQAGMLIVTIENHVAEGGFASIACDVMTDMKPRLLRFGWPSGILGWGKVDTLRKKHGMTPESIAKSIKDSL